MGARLNRLLFLAAADAEEEILLTPSSEVWLRHRELRRRPCFDEAVSQIFAFQDEEKDPHRQTEEKMSVTGASVVWRLRNRLHDASGEMIHGLSNVGTNRLVQR